MASPEEIVVKPRTGEDSNPEYEGDRDSIQQNSTKRKRSKKRRSSGESRGSAHASPPIQVPEEGQEEDESARQGTRPPADRKEQDTLSPAQEDRRARFYEDYRKIAEEYDKGFLKKYEEDLNTTLIFAGLFSAVASAFIIQVDSQLRPDPGDETVALLRILLYKIDNATFGNNVPSLPQWTGPPPTMVYVQAILFASLSASLFSAFLAMLGKQWLNRYESTDLRGSAIERSQNRQRKLDGIASWYFDSVMESLPLMLQVALLLLGCALSRYLWEVNITIASVVLGVTSFGLLFYLFILVAGTVWESCPYQTPGSQLFRCFWPKVLHSATSATRTAIKKSVAVEVVQWLRRPLFQSTWGEIVEFLVILILMVPVSLAMDIYHLVKAAIRESFAGAYNLLPVVHSLPKELDQRTVALDLRCISWTLRTSLETPVRLSTLNYLVTIAEFTNLYPPVAVDCFNTFAGYVIVSNGKVVIMQGLEQLATLSADCFSQTLRHLSGTHPTSSVPTSLRRRYDRIFPSQTKFWDLPFFHTMINIHALASKNWKPGYHGWSNYKPSNQELIKFARNMVVAARVEYQQRGNEKVPRWILRFALHFLSQGPPPPKSVVADCLTIITIALDNDLLDIPNLDESARVEQLSCLITQKLETMAGVPGTDLISRSKRKVISVLFPYAVHLAQAGQQGMVNTILRFPRHPQYRGFMWRHIHSYIAILFDESTPPSLNQAIVFASPYAYWNSSLYTQNAVARWAAAVRATPYSVEVCRSVVDAMLQIALVDALRPHIPFAVWAWLKKQSPVRYMWGLYRGSTPDVLHHIRGLGDIEILKSYLLLVWTQEDPLSGPYLAATEIAIREEFSGVAMRRHREDLTKLVDSILEGMEREVRNNRTYYTDGVYNDWNLIPAGRGSYQKLRDVLQQVGTEERGTSSCTSPSQSFSGSMLTPLGMSRILLNRLVCPWFRILDSRLHFPHFLYNCLQFRIISTQFVPSPCHLP